jgi:hypothetical protein
MRTRITSAVRRELSEIGFVVSFWEEYNFDNLLKVPVREKKGKQKVTYSDCVMMIDTETSPFCENPQTEEEHRNHVCMWSLAINTLGMDICALWGKKPSDLMKCLHIIKEKLRADEVYCFVHNLSYDWTFLRKFFFSAFGWPCNQLNTKPLYPITIRFENGLVLRDSLCLAQRSLEKWAKDLDVEHKKAVGKWDYDLIRHFDCWEPTANELEYALNDVLAGVECIAKTIKLLKKSVRSLPVTATGIPRTESRDIGKKHRAHAEAVKRLPDHYETQLKFELGFHGGYTHPNRFIKRDTYPNYLKTLHWLIRCMDYASSYPFQCLAKKMPDSKFELLDDPNIDAHYILDSCEDYAYLIHIKALGARLRDPRWPMPALQDAKCGSSVNNILDNGRIIKSDYFDMWITDKDFMLIYEQYAFDELIFDEVWFAHKDYLPRWFRDYIYKLFKDKTMLKGEDPVNYMIAKAKLNAASFGMCAQRPVKADIVEDYSTGAYGMKEGFDFEEEYQKHLKNFNTFLPYSWGVWITAEAQYDLFELGKCVPKDDIWLYSDTDSVYATGFDEEKLAELNAKRRQMLIDQGYAPIEWKGKEYMPGVAEDDGTYMQFKAIHSKCYCKRPLTAYGDNFIMGEDLKITVAGVPKRGAKSLHNNINNFDIGTIFPGTESGKKQHTYYYVEEIYTDCHGNETGDSIELSPCDYLINDPNKIDWDELLREEVTINDYEDFE